MNLSSRKMGMHEWSYKNDYNPVERRLMPHVSLKERFKKLNIEVELGFTAEQVARRCSAASTATCRPCSRPSCASSATPASTSARSTA